MLGWALFAVVVGGSGGLTIGAPLDGQAGAGEGVGWNREVPKFLIEAAERAMAEAYARRASGQPTVAAPEPPEEVAEEAEPHCATDAWHTIRAHPTNPRWLAVATEERLATHTIGGDTRLLITKGEAIRFAWREGGLVFTDGRHLRELRRDGRLRTLLTVPADQALAGLLITGGQLVTWTYDTIHVGDRGRWRRAVAPDAPLEVTRAVADARGTVHLYGWAGYRCGADSFVMQVPRSGAARGTSGGLAISAWLRTGKRPPPDIDGDRVPFTLRGPPPPGLFVDPPEHQLLGHPRPGLDLWLEDERLVLRREDYRVAVLGSVPDGTQSITRAADGALYAATESGVVRQEGEAWAPLPCAPQPAQSVR